MATEGFPEVFTVADIDRLQRSWNEGYQAGLAAAVKPPDAERIEDALTWREANKLRILATEHRRAMHAAVLLARAEDDPRHLVEAADAQHTEAVLLERKVSDMFDRLSASRGPGREQ